MAVMASSSLRTGVGSARTSTSVQRKAPVGAVRLLHASVVGKHLHRSGARCTDWMANCAQRDASANQAKASGDPRTYGGVGVFRPPASSQAPRWMPAGDGVQQHAAAGDDRRSGFVALGHSLLLGQGVGSSATQPSQHHTAAVGEGHCLQQRAYF